eukprot:CAMPEP_0184659302 /NCGR_PEP_ID=MMETSP0308-20130426/29124_1 /TAXON_ID=38269 /ORGANISM="Gloeochaete witrockiana, Strain SAG 46.84" /LENGTH=604 /DNA_ID=CAMNT_0027099021 /DNA_START=60 /DNA_END=1874 /DNA_ORIENTATION=+
MTTQEQIDSACSSSSLLPDYLVPAYQQPTFVPFDPTQEMRHVSSPSPGPLGYSVLYNNLPCLESARSSSELESEDSLDNLDMMFDNLVDEEHNDLMGSLMSMGEETSLAGVNNNAPNPIMGDFLAAPQQQPSFGQNVLYQGGCIPYPIPHSVSVGWPTSSYGRFSLDLQPTTAPPQQNLETRRFSVELGHGQTQSPPLSSESDSCTSPPSVVVGIKTEDKDEIPPHRRTKLKGGDPTRLRRPQNAFIIFSNYARKHLKNAHRSTMSTMEISRALGAQWRALPKDDKKYFEDLAHRTRNEFKAAHPEFKYASSRKKSRSLKVEDGNEQMSEEGGGEDVTDGVPKKMAVMEAKAHSWSGPTIAPAPSSNKSRRGSFSGPSVHQNFASSSQGNMEPGPLPEVASEVVAALEEVRRLFGAPSSTSALPQTFEEDKVQMPMPFCGALNGHNRQMQMESMLQRRQTVAIPQPHTAAIASHGQQQSASPIQPQMNRRRSFDAAFYQNSAPTVTQQNSTNSYLLPNSYQAPVSAASSQSSRVAGSHHSGAVSMSIPMNKVHRMNLFGSHMTGIAPAPQHTLMGGLDMSVFMPTPNDFFMLSHGALPATFSST